MAEGDTVTNAFIGALATALLSSFIPFAPAAGGAVAGYLQGPNTDDGLRVGTVSGLIAFIPTVLVASVVIWIVTAVLTGIGGPGPLLGGIGAVLIVVVVIFAAVYIVGLSMLGGWIGSSLKDRHDTSPYGP